MTYEILFGLITFAVVSSITPGPNNLMLLASGVNYGFRRTVPHMLGIAFGFGLMIISIGFGLAALFEAMPMLQIGLEILCALYLSYLAYRIATAEPMGQAEQANSGAVKGGSPTRPFSFLQAALFQWVNPKAWAMGLTAIAVYAPTSLPYIGVGMVALIFTTINLPCVSLWAYAGQRMRLVLGNRRFQRLFNGFCAFLLMASLFPMLR